MDIANQETAVDVGPSIANRLGVAHPHVNQLSLYERMQLQVNVIP